MKYVFRRFVAGVVIVPAVAIAWVLIHAGLIGLGADPVAPASEVFIHGLVLGSIVQLLFVLDSVMKVVRK